MSDPPSAGPPLGPEELRTRTIKRVFARLLRLRRVFAPALLAFALWLGVSDAAPWRQILMVVLAGFLATVVIVDTVMVRRGVSPELHVIKPSLAALAFMQHVMIFASGGMVSPVLPLVLPVTFLTALLSSTRQAWMLVLCLHIPALWLSAGLQLGAVVELRPTVFIELGTPTPALLATVALIMSLAVFMTTFMSTQAAAGLDEMVAEALAARDAALASRAEQTRQLTTLSGEIAHELKNPLASVKGLAALVQRSELPGKAGERMQVLRREVDRMQEILEEFLNFSRPLVPLDQRELELRELVDHVVELHEGVAVERRVELEARGRARVRCDPRKVEQILINLVQNALEVAPPDSRVELEITREDAADSEDDEVGIRVRDQGPGLDPELRARVFEAGVTGKTEGSGLGLTIARALARQHGGALELRDRSDDIGCEAWLTLPRAGLEPDPQGGKHD